MNLDILNYDKSSFEYRPAILCRVYCAPVHSAHPRFCVHYTRDY